MRYCLRASVLTLYVFSHLLMPLSAYADDGDLDTSFSPSMPAIGWAMEIALQSDGKVIKVGTPAFDSNYQLHNVIVRFNSDGSFDSSFNENGSGFPNGTGYAVAVQADGKILVGGQLSGGSYNGTNTPNNLIRLNSDGTLDTSFNANGAGPEDAVHAILVLPNGKIIIGGQFSSYNGSTARGIARLNSDGTLDTDFNGGTQGALIKSLMPASDGKIIVGGAFAAMINNNTLMIRCIARLNTDGSFDTTFNADGTGFNGDSGCWVNDLAQQSDGKIIVGGDFETYNGTTVPFGLARLSSNGSLDATFNSGGAGLDRGSSHAVETLSVQANDKILVGGIFTAYNGIDTQNHFIRLNANGAYDASFFACRTGINLHVLSSALQPDGDIIVGGVFSAYNGTSRSNIARITLDGSASNGASCTVDPPASTSVVLDSDDSVDVSETEQTGIKKVRVVQDGNVVAIFDMDFTVQRSLNDVQIDFDPVERTTVVHNLGGHDGVSGDITMIVAKDESDTLLFYCPEKDTPGCTVGDPALGAVWDANGNLVATYNDFNAEPFTVSVIPLNGGNVFSVVGPITSGGESHSPESVPEFSTIALVALLLACGYYLHRNYRQPVLMSDLYADEGAVGIL